MTTFTDNRRANPTWIAAFIHRISGLTLAAFLPVHFYVLAFALNGEAKLEGFLRWTDQPAVKIAEGALVFLLVVHALGGLRLLLLENTSWRGGQARVALGAIGAAVALAIVFLVRVL
ncbi:MAG TPA: succinate dehydrogenase, cytochrome b subunit [Pseudolabrys sp.]|nr:succinate dehydrogenase, cytochrome b subunit [Pseudolabrys sp.]